ncbi:hypothetical protein SAMN05421858_4995 [Haladaptatus litoreus]|uniref:Uncharacterized protein n=1 Tax=Haladaptatus litoreus TaxID=553468 RepID=A0A1N7FEA7_9EURY|nr:hypothetical protein SAMN05421858_4995 [Haladaptatus litoreus]
MNVSPSNDDIANETVKYSVADDQALLRFLVILTIILGVQAFLELFPVLVRVAGVTYFSLIFLGRLPLYVSLLSKMWTGSPRTNR